MCFTHEEKYRYLFTSTHTVDFVCFANWGSDNIIRCSAVYFGNATREIKIFNTARHTVGAIISAIFARVTSGVSRYVIVDDIMFLHNDGTSCV